MKRILYMLVVCAVIPVLSCTEQGSLKFIEKGGTFVPEPKSLASFAKSLAAADADRAALMLDRAFSDADSLGALKATSETVGRLSDGLYAALTGDGTPEYRCAIAEMMLDREVLCTTLDPIDFKRIDYKRGRLDLNRPGRLVNNFAVQAADGSEHMLRDLIGRRTVLFVYGSSCPECDKAMSQISKSSFIKKVADDGELNLVALYAGESNDEFAKKSARLQGWTNVMDLDNVIMYENAFDSGLMPSFYLISENGIVDVRASRSLKDIEKADALARRTSLKIALEPSERVWGGKDSRRTIYAVQGQFIPYPVRERRQPGTAAHPYKQRTLCME